jgi:hypothetical protein
MANIHMILQGKGGVGKSFIASTLAQYSRHQGQLPLCIDTDPVNATFAGYQSMDVKRLHIMDNNEINSRYFDTLIELIAPIEVPVIIDNGASAFVQLSHYLVTNKVCDVLHEMGHTLLIHTVITGGQALLDTINGFSQLVHQFKDNTNFIVWLNPYWGSITLDGKKFEEMKVYQEHKHRISSLIQIPTLKEETYGYDVNHMLQQRLTFNEAISSPDRTIMTRQRLKIVRDNLFNLLDNAVI